MGEQTMVRSLRGMVLAGVVLAAPITGCASRAVVNQPSDAVVLELGPKDYKITGVGKGKDCKHVVFGVQTASASLARAETQALQQSGGKFLINKRLYAGDENDYFFVKDRCRYVEGTGIAF